MKTLLIYIVFAFIAVAFQGTLMSQAARPDIILILVIFYSIKHGQMRGVMYAVLTGALIDSASGIILGPNIMSKVITAYFVPSIRRKLFQWNIIISTVIIVIFSIFDVMLNILCLTTFAGLSFENMPFRVPITRVIYTIAAGAVLYVPFFRFKGDKQGTF
jgi:rod shape-determining protein MreD